jgi:gliding motility-associated-like protein
LLSRHNNYQFIFYGGFGPFEYVWSTGETTEDIIVGAGTFSLTIMDSLGCQHTENISLIQPDPISLNFTTVNLANDLDCDGEATVFATGGVGGYSYLWSNSATSDNITGLCYGLYEVTVTDANGCEAVGSTVVNKPSCLAFEVSAIGSDLDCYAYNDGNASASADFGTLPYEFTWNTIPPQTGPVATNLTAGTYVVTAEDGVGCLKQASVVVTQPSQLLNTITKTDVAVIGENTGTATSNPSGGTPGYSFLWTPGGQTTQTAIDLFAGVYYLELKDDNNCTLIDSVKINQPPCNDFLVAVNTTNVLCHGQNNGQANIVILNGNPPFEIAWSNGATNVTAVTGLSPLTYSVTVTDALGCEVFQNFTITQPDLLQVSLVPTNVTCNGAGDGTIDLTVTGGVAPMSYSWFRGGTPYASSEDLINLTSGTYSVVVRDMNNCTATASTGISQPAAINITLTSQVDVTCYEGSDGSLDISVSGGQIPYFYSWTNGETTHDISGLEFGNYQVTVTDGNNCTRTALYVVNQPAEVEILDVVVPCPVPGATTVDITVSEIFGGALYPYSISLDNGATFSASGTYKFTVNTGSDYELVAMDENGCISPVYNLSLDPTVTIDDIIFNPCIPIGNTTQLVEVVPAGGDGVSYEVSTDDGFTFAAPGVFTFSLNIASSYDIVVRDSKGCLSAVERIFVPGVLTATPNLDTEVSCVGENDGAVSLMVTGGVPPFTFSWEGPGLFTSSDQNISGLFEGTFEVLVTDSNNCTTTASIFVSTILDITNPVITCAVVDSEFVFADLDECFYTHNSDSWDATATDNCVVSSIVYVLSGVTTGSGTSLDGVEFNVGITLVTWTATDGLGNTDECSYYVVVEDNQLPVITNCPNDIFVNNDTGVCGAEVAWIAPSASDNCEIQSFTSTHNSGDFFPVGTTTVTYTLADTSGNVVTCSFDVVVTDNENPVITNCPDDIFVNNDANVCGATVTWAAPSASDNCEIQSFTSTHNSGDFFPVGTTTVTYTLADTSGNVVTCSFDVVVTDNENPVITTCPDDIATCDSLVFFSMPTAADNCGSVTITQTQGLTSGSIFPVGTNLQEFEIEDQYGNISVCSFNVTIHPTASLSVSTTDVQCFGFANGMIDLTVSSGTTPFTYSWSNGADTEDISGLEPGQYSVTVSDFFGCSETISASISQPTELLLSAVFQNISCNGFSDGLIDATVSGGVLPYTYSWSNGADTEDISDLAAGQYGLTVTDFNGCEKTISITLTEPEILAASATSIDATCSSNDGLIDLTVTGGTTPFSYEWSNGATTQDISDLVYGDYTVSITDFNGCELIFTQTVSSSSIFSISARVRDVLCYGDATGSISIEMLDGTSPFSIEWSNGGIENTISNLTAGEYSVFVTDSNMCQVTETYVVSEADELTMELYSPTVVLNYNVSNYGATDGSIELEIEGGTAPYSFNWSNGITSQNLDNIGAGEYFVVVTDANGCVISDQITLSQSMALDIPEGFSPNNDGKNDYFVIKGVEIYSDNTLEIYNRWGNLVYKMNGYNNQWDGNNLNGKELPDATYFVIFKIHNIGFQYNGYVDLRRSR